MKKLSYIRRYQEILEIQRIFEHRLMIRRSEVLNLSPASIYKFSYIRTLRRHLCFIKRSLYFYTPRYTPHTLQFFSNSLLFQTQEVQTILHHVVFFIKGLNNQSTSILPQLTSLSSFMSKEAQRRCAKQELSFLLVRNCLSGTGGGQYDLKHFNHM